jgi:hypothetical protein
MIGVPIKDNDPLNNKTIYMTKDLSRFDQVSKILLVK